MNIALEFHDSTVGAVVGSAGLVRVLFSGAYTHHSTGRPGFDAGSGYLQPVELLLSRAVLLLPASGCVGRVSDGELVIDGQSMSLVPLPFSASGNVTLSLTFTSGNSISVSATSVSCRATGEGAFIETYAAG